MTNELAKDVKSVTLQYGQNLREIGCVWRETLRAPKGMSAYAVALGRKREKTVTN